MIHTVLLEILGSVDAALQAGTLTHDEAIDLLRGLRDEIGVLAVTTTGMSERLRARALQWREENQTIEARIQRYARQRAKRLDALFAQLAEVLPGQRRLPPTDNLAELLHSSPGEARIVRARWLAWSQALIEAYRSLSENHQIPTLETLLPALDYKLTEQDARALLTTLATARDLIGETNYLALCPLFANAQLGERT